MARSFLQIIVVLSVLFALPARAGIAGATADGAWDWRGRGENRVLVIADKTYAFVKPGGRVRGYGKLIQVGYAEYDLPHFVVIDGYLKEEIGAVGIALKGPRRNGHDLAGELLLALIITGENLPYCKRRAEPSCWKSIFGDQAGAGAPASAPGIASASGASAEPPPTFF